MDKQQYKTLKKISRKSSYLISESKGDEQDRVHYLADCGYLKYESAPDDSRLYCYINQNGKSALYEWRKERRHWYIPLLVSVIAAIGGYRQELTWLIQAIKSLCKSLPIG